MQRIKTTISVPAGNAVVSTIKLDKTNYRIRFAYNDTRNFWYFGMYDTDDNPIMVGLKIVPNVPLNLFHGHFDFDGYFIAESKLDRIGRFDFQNGSATFSYVRTVGDDK